MNRLQRRSNESALKKQIKQVLVKKEWGPWEDKSLSFREKRGTKNAFGFYANDIYSVQVYCDNGQVVAGIRRHDESVDIPWSHKQRIKNELFGKESLFVECFPPEDKLIDQANIFWIWEMGWSSNAFDLKSAIG